MQQRTKTVVTTVLVSFAWVVAVAVGLRFMLNYERTAGRSGVVPEVWPLASSIKRAADRPTLLLFAHPRCPCTRATMSELAQLMTHAKDKLDARVVFFAPANATADWSDTDLHRAAASLPGVTILSDAAGTEAKRFGAETSGHTLLFAADGRLLFNGGITASRGHAGDNAGESAILAIVNGQPAPRNQTLVFGCSFEAHESLAQVSSK